MSLTVVVRKTLTRLQQEHESITPDSFARVFCQEAKRAGITVEECDRIDRFRAKFSPPLAKMASEYHINNIDELLTFLTAQANRQQPSRRELNENSLIDLVRRILLVISKFPDRDLKKEAGFTLGRDLTHPAILQDERKRWAKIAAEFDLSFLDTLDRYGAFHKEHLPILIEEIEQHLTRLEQPEELKSVASLIVEVLSPGLEEGSRERLEKLGAELEEQPGLLTSEGMQSEIRELAAHRLLGQSEILSDKADRFTQMLEALRGEIGSQVGTNEDLMAQADELLDGSHGDLGSKLLGLFEKAGSSFKTLSGALKTRIEDTHKLQEEIASLKAELNIVKEQVRTDEITGIFSRRAITQSLSEREARFSQERSDYGLIFLKIDRFDSLTDDLGRDSGEVVLSVVAKHLKSHLKGSAQIGRYGGSTFLVIVQTRSAEALLQFARSLATLAHKKRFLYESRAFQVTLSGGTALRSACGSLKNSLNHADAALRSARLGGGAQVKGQP
jgi:diguanylate cyclase (GGDEF)-like protein